MTLAHRPPSDAGVVRAIKSERSCPAAAYPWIVAATVLASSMVFIDSSAVNLALPVIQTELHATIADSQWIIEAEALFLSSLILVGGSLGDYYGRRRIFLYGTIGFTAASILCAAAANATQLVVARGVQGVASALLTPGSLAILGASFDEKQRGQAIGIWSSFTAIAGVAGPLLGGLIVQHASWRWIFLINIPIAVATVAITLRWVAESRDPNHSGRLDWAGASLATLSLLAIVYALISAGVKSWTPPITACFVLGFILGAAFFIVEAKSPEPMMPLSLFSSRTFSAVNLETLLLYAALGGATFLLPFNLILVQRYTPTAAGAALLPLVALMFLLSPWAGSLVPKIGAKILLVGGSALAALGFAWLAVPYVGGSYWTTFFPPIVMMSLGMSFVVAPLTTTVMDSVGTEHFGLASGINNAVARTGSLIAIAALSLIVANVFNHSLDRRLAGMSLPTSAVAAINAQRPKLAAAQAPKSLPEGQRREVARDIADSYVDGYRVALLVAAGLAAAGSLCAAIFLESKRA